MKIKQLGLIAFGPFSNYELNFGENNMFNLVYGLNEAGKTTVLRAIRDLFYGIPQRSPDAYLHPSSKLRIRAVLETKNGQELILTRRKGRKNTLLDEKDNPVGENLLQQYLGAINRESFSLMFGLDHLNLRQGGVDLLRGQGALGEALFEAASGIGGLRELFQELEREAGDLFKPSGSRPPLNVNLERYRQLKNQIGQLSLAPRRWSELEDDYLTQKKRVEQFRQEEKTLTKNKIRLERLERTLPLIARRDRDLKEIDLLGAVPVLPPSFKERRLELTGKRSAAARAGERAKKEKEELEEKVGQIDVPEKLLEHAGDISALQESLDTYRGYLQEIPSLEGEITELRQEALVLLRQLKPSFTTLEEAESLRLPLALIKEIKDLAGQHPLLLQQHTAACKQENELQRSLNKLSLEKEKIGSPKDINGLNKALNRARRKGSLEEELRKTLAGAESLHQNLTSKLNALGLWSGTLQQLQQLPLPLDETMRIFEERFQAIRDQRRRVDDKIVEEENKLSDYQRRLTNEELAGEVPTEEKLEKAREHRQHGWHLIRRAWLERKRDADEEHAFHAEQPLHIAYELSVTRTDELADRLRFEAGRTERTSLLMGEIKKCREIIGLLNGEQSEIQKKNLELEQEWSAAWEKAGIIPLTPGEMLSWLQRCREITDGLAQLDVYSRTGKELSQAIGGHREEINQELQKLGESAVKEQESLEILLDRIQKIGEKYQAKTNQLENIEKMSKITGANLDSARRQKTEAETALAGWQQKWSRALTKAGLPADISLEATSLHLDLLEKLFQKNGELDRKQVSRTKMETYITNFAERLQDLLAKLTPDLSDAPADYAATQLQARVIDARRNRDKQNNLLEQSKKAAKNYKIAAQEMEEAEQGIKELMQQARCNKEAELPEVIEKAERLAKLRENVDNLEKQLLSLGGGLPLEKIKAETRGVNGDTLPGELEEIEILLTKNRQAQDELNRIFGITENEYKEKIEGASTDALEAAEETQSVLSELSEQTEQYLRLRLASIVLRRGIERYREENQNPVIKLAGKLFASLTGGSFSGLQVDFDESDNPILLGLRPTEEKVPIAGMSDGTLDQLYLSLRLASLERFLEQNEPLPFILDDLLVNFDDLRAAETMKVLGKFAEKTQVLFFTHHLSFVELAKKTIPHTQQLTLI